MAAFNNDQDQEYRHGAHATDPAKVERIPNGLVSSCSKIFELEFEVSKVEVWKGWAAFIEDN